MHIIRVVPKYGEAFGHLIYLVELSEEVWDKFAKTETKWLSFIDCKDELEAYAKAVEWLKRGGTAYEYE